MQPLLCAIATILLLAALPYLFTFWVVQKKTLQCLRTENTSPDKVPVHLKAIFQTVITELEQYDFRASGYHLTEWADKEWRVLLQHETQQTYVFLTIRQPSNVTPVTLLFATFFTDGCQLDTVNSRFYGIFSQNPKDVDQYLETVAVGEQWQAHQRKLVQLSETKTPRTLSPEAFIATLEDNSRANVERLVQNREVYWVQPGSSYRLTWWTALKSVFKVARRRGQRVDQSQNQSPFNKAPVDSVIELEVDEFHRRQQRQQGFSRPAKHWLLLGTLALFIVSYSSVFKPQKLVIFITVLLLHEGGHVLAMKLFGYRDAAMLFVPFLGALATARKQNASLTEKVWVSLAGPLPGLLLGIGLALAFSFTQLNTNGTNLTAWYEESNWVREASWMLVILNLFNLLPIYPLDGGQVADLLLFSRNPYLGVLFKGVGVLLLGLLGLQRPLMLMFALLIGVTIPSSFHLAKLNTTLRQELRLIPSGDEEHLVRFIFGKLQAPQYRSLPFAKKYGLVLGLLENHREGTARWTTRIGLSFIYIASLFAGMVGGLYALMPNRTVWTTNISHYIQGPAAYQQRMKQELEQANRVLQANPRDVGAYLQRGRARLSLQDYTGAMNDANQVLRLDPNSSKGYGLREMARLRRGDVKGAEADREKARSLTLGQRIQRLDRSLSRNPKDVNAYLARASTWSALGNYKEAIADCDRVLRLNSQNVEVLLNRGEAYFQLKDYKGATADANQVLSIRPNSVEAYDLRSRARRQLGDEKGAIADEQKSQTLERSQENVEN